MPTYTVEDLEDLEEASESATPIEQSTALALVANVLEGSSIAYGVIGGMNFYLRGSGRTTGDVDIAVDRRPRMDALLNLFNSQQRLIPNVFYFRPIASCLLPEVISSHGKYCSSLTNFFTVFIGLPTGCNGFPVSLGSSSISRTARTVRSQAQGSRRPSNPQ